MLFIAELEFNSKKKKNIPKLQEYTDRTQDSDGEKKIEEKCELWVILIPLQMVPQSLLLTIPPLTCHFPRSSLYVPASMYWSPGIVSHPGECWHTAQHCPRSCAVFRSAVSFVSVRFNFYFILFFYIIIISIIFVACVYVSVNKSTISFYSVLQEWVGYRICVSRSAGVYRREGPLRGSKEEQQRCSP